MLRLNDREVVIIYQLLKERKHEGSYFGNKESYYSRLDSAIEKIEDHLDREELKP